MDPRKGLSAEELKVRDARNAQEMSSLKGMMTAYDPSAGLPKNKKAPI